MEEPGFQSHRLENKHLHPIGQENYTDKKSHSVIVEPLHILEFLCYNNLTCSNMINSYSGDNIKIDICKFFLCIYKCDQYRHLLDI